MPIAMETLVAAAQAAADVAGAAIRPFFRSGSSYGFDTILKADLSSVTIADRTAELAMRAVFGERFPEHGIMGEEFGLQHPDARFRWVLDPIDGTRAFITGPSQVWGSGGNRRWRLCIVSWMKFLSVA